MDPSLSWIICIAELILNFMPPVTSFSMFLINHKGDNLLELMVTVSVIIRISTISCLNLNGVLPCAFNRDINST